MNQMIQRMNHFFFKIVCMYHLIRSIEQLSNEDQCFVVAILNCPIYSPMPLH